METSWLVWLVHMKSPLYREPRWMQSCMLTCYLVTFQFLHNTRYIHHVSVAYFCWKSFQMADLWQRRWVGRSLPLLVQGLWDRVKSVCHRQLNEGGEKVGTLATDSIRASCHLLTLLMNNQNFRAGVNQTTFCEFVRGGLTRMETHLTIDTHIQWAHKQPHVHAVQYWSQVGIVCIRTTITRTYHSHIKAAKLFRCPRILYV